MADPGPRAAAATFVVGPRADTVLVWCEAFSVEFVGATITV